MPSSSHTRAFDFATDARFDTGGWFVNLLIPFGERWRRGTLPSLQQILPILKFLGSQPIREPDLDEVLRLQGEVPGQGGEDRPNGSSWPEEQ
jgi:hypothetical protein